MGPTINISKELHAEKYRGDGEDFEGMVNRIVGVLSDNESHRKALKDILCEQRFLPAGRVQAAVGSPKYVTPWNCFVSRTIEDSMDGIMDAAKEAATTMRLGGGIGYDFSTLRPRGALIKTLDSRSSGALSFMDVFNSVCGTISSAGHRRGAQMGVLRVDHPDIEEFVRAKRNSTRLTNFNISVGITNEFMEAVLSRGKFNLRFEGRIYKQVDAYNLWEEIMRSTYDWAEPGVLFIDRINEKNNLWYCEKIAATNPCLHPDTLIETVEGRIRIADIKQPIKVYTSNPDGSLGIAQASSAWVSKKDVKVWKISTRNGKEIKVTPDHKILTHERGWVEAKDLKLGDRIVQLCRARRGSEYSGVKLTTEGNRAYRMEHRMIAESVYGPLGDSVVHHINNDTYDNHIDNFEVMTAEEHNRLTASTTHPQEHQVHSKVNGRFVTTGTSPKRVTPMPEHLKSNMKNNYSNAVVEIVEDFETTDVYDLSVEGTHNMIGNFMVVHNCGEQPLPPYGACLLGSFNLVKYIMESSSSDSGYTFNVNKFINDIPHVIRAMDNIIDNGIYPLEEQEKEGKNKRRMGIGVTGLANTLEIVGAPYGSPEAIHITETIMEVLRNVAYLYSVELACEKGAFPYFTEEYGERGFVSELPADILGDIRKHGIRNSHLLSVAPTGTISLCADNVSSGIEPPFSLEYERKILEFEGHRIEKVKDYANEFYGVKGKTTDEVTIDEHVTMLNTVSKYVDSACSKTCNVPSDIAWEDFKDVYIKAYQGGASGCTTYRKGGKREGIFSDTTEENASAEGAACYINPDGTRTCDE